MGYKVIPIKETEESYTYFQSQELFTQAGLIGYLRGDMGTNGDMFYSSWFDFSTELKTDVFKKEFDIMINTFRAKGKFLSDRSTLSNFCHTNAKPFVCAARAFGVRIDSDNYVYLMRLNPYKGEYNLYCYCFKKDLLERHLHNAEKGIRFTDLNGHDLFRIADGGYIRITYPNGKTEDKKCRYIDDWRIEIGTQIYHALDFAGYVKNSGASVEPLSRVLKEE